MAMETMTRVNEQMVVAAKKPMAVQPVSPVCVN